MSYLFLNKALDADALEAFLQAQFPGQGIYLYYKTEIDWAREHKDVLVFEYECEEYLDVGFRFCLNPPWCVPTEHCVVLSEKLAFELSQHFDCAVVCYEASRVQLIEHDPYYSLLFEAGRVYLVSDADWDETGQVKKIAELSYDWPDHALNAGDSDSAASQLMIRFDTPLEYPALQAFLARQFPGHNIHLWDAEQGAEPLRQDVLNIEMCHSDAMDTGFKHYLLLHFVAGQGNLTQRHETTENLSAALSREFDCTSVCRAARRDPKPNPNEKIHYAPWLMFKKGRVYWARADAYQEVWEFYPTVELNYDWPNYPQHHQTHRKNR